MKLYVLAVRDIKANGYAAPMFLPSIALGERSFADAVNTEDANSNLYKHPDDFELWLIATWDDITGGFENVMPPQSICAGGNVKIVKRPNT